MSTTLEYYTAADLLHRTAPREGEVRLGEVLPTVDPQLWESEQPLPYKFVIVGVEEDFGVRANFGRGGAQHSFAAFLSFLCNMQDNRFFPTESVAVLGAVVATAREEDDQIVQLRKATAQNDFLVSSIVERIVRGGAIPIVIGGGHNNAYGCLRGTSSALGHPVSCLNIDAHTDLRALEGRHSGNGFRYAMEHGYLERYFMLGLQENYTPEYIWQFIEDHELVDYLSFDDYLSGEESLEEAYVRIAELLGSHFALEIDVDVIAQFPSSAQSISGFSYDQVREMVYALDVVPHYLHLCEGRIGSDQEAPIVGRGLALLVADFIKSHIFSE